MWKFRRQYLKMNECRRGLHKVLVTYVHITYIVLWSVGVSVILATVGLNHQSVEARQLLFVWDHMKHCINPDAASVLLPAPYGLVATAHLLVYSLAPFISLPCGST